jgi:hypothetical protein
LFCFVLPYQLFSFHCVFVLLGGCSKHEHSWNDGLVTLTWMTSKRMSKCVPLHVKTMCFVQMLMKQIFNTIGVSACINFANAPQLFINPCNIFHCVSRSKNFTR